MRYAGSRVDRLLQSLHSQCLCPDGLLLVPGAVLPACPLHTDREPVPPTAPGAAARVANA